MTKHSGMVSNLANSEHLHQTDHYKCILQAMGLQTEKLEQ